MEKRGLSFLPRRDVLSQRKMAELFGVDSNTATYHLREIYKSSELNEIAITRKFRAVQIEGSQQASREVEFYSLNTIVAVR